MISCPRGGSLRAQGILGTVRGYPIENGAATAVNIFPVSCVHTCASLELLANVCNSCRPTVISFSRWNASRMAVKPFPHLSLQGFCNEQILLA